jgi:hypothetical protein
MTKLGDMFRIPVTYRRAVDEAARSGAADGHGSINDGDSRRWTPFHLACSLGSLECAQLLLSGQLKRGQYHHTA